MAKKIMNINDMNKRLEAARQILEKTKQDRLKETKKVSTTENKIDPSNRSTKRIDESKQKSPKPPKDFQLIKAIRGKKQKNILGEPELYKANITNRDNKVRKFIDENQSRGSKSQIFPGQMIMFNYFEPQTKEDLEYYDAMPCTIFFGVQKTQNGPRVIGFNLHYYPPRLRYEILNRIFDIYKPMYLESWDKPVKSEINRFDYKMIAEQLNKINLGFGIRKYIPQLMGNIKPIPPKWFQKAVFTEGRFKKETRTQILKYWSTMAAKKYNYR